MPINLKGRSVLTLGDLSPAEIRFLLRLAAELKAAKTAGLETPRLKGKNIALIFEKDSTRTRTGPIWCWRSWATSITTSRVRWLSVQ